MRIKEEISVSILKRFKYIKMKINLDKRHMLFSGNEDRSVNRENCVIKNSQFFVACSTLPGVIKKENSTERIF